MTIPKSIEGALLAAEPAASLIKNWLKYFPLEQLVTISKGRPGGLSLRALATIRAVRYRPTSRCCRSTLAFEGQERPGGGRLDESCRRISKSKAQISRTPGLAADLEVLGEIWELVFSILNGDRFMAFLISIKAGSEGLNLVSASTVMLLDEDWNPQVMRQAEARVHRLEQKKPGTIFKIHSRGTAEG